MSASLIVHVDAQTELDAAATWYEERRVGLGLGFVAAIDRTFQRIAERPEAFAVYRAPIRRAVVHRFPYIVFFEAEAHRVVVYAVAHARRRPGYWLGRGLPDT